MLTQQGVRGECAKLAALRAAAIVRRRLQRGVNSLALIVSTAPLAGVFGTVLGIVCSFVGCDG